MHLITETKQFLSKKAHPQHVFVICPFGAKVVHMRRLIGVLLRAGYDVTAIAYSKGVLSRGDPKLLPQLMDEVETVLAHTKSRSQSPPLLVGVSLGGLVAFNLLKRNHIYRRAIAITGGNIVTAAKRFYDTSIWPQSEQELSLLWQDVNIHSAPEVLRGKRFVMVVPIKDNVIDSNEVFREHEKQVAAGNHFVMIRRRWLNHRFQFIAETILFPGRIKKYIRLLGD